MKPVKAWNNQQTQLNSTNNALALAPAASRTPVIKRDPNTNPILTQMTGQISNCMPNTLITQSTDSTMNSVTGNLGDQNNLNTLNNQNSMGTAYNSGYSSMGGYGGYGGYGSSYGSYGGYGGGYGMGHGSSMLGGFGGSCGMGSYGYGGMGMYGRNQNESPDILDRCFFVVERLNYQMFHFCEMTRMIQSQSASLVYFLEIMGKIYTYMKEFIVTKSKSDFFFVNQVNNDQENESKIKSHIKIIDKFIKYLLFSAAVSYTIKFVFGKITA